MAAAVHELGPRTNLKYANTAKVMRQALHWAGLLQGKIAESFESYNACPEVAQFYEAMIAMMPQSSPPEVLFECGGNWGSSGEPPASAHFTSCRLTKGGWSLAAKLLERYPNFREDLHVKHYGPAAE